MTIAPARISFLDNLRYSMVMLVLVYHSVGAYAIVAPHWVIHDTPSFAADMIRELFDVFMMPALFFIAGYLALNSLEKKGAWEFLKDKVRRLLIPWALAVLIVLPLAIYDQPIKPVSPFWKFWLWYMSSFEVRLRLTQAPEGPTTQAIYWFISLLFAFFLLFAFVFVLSRRWRSEGKPLSEVRTTSSRSILTVLVSVGLSTSIGYFILLRLFPDSSWFTLHMFLEFQVTRLLLFAGYFAFGVYAQSRGWFANGNPIGSLKLWGTTSVVLAIAYLLIGQPVFAGSAGATNLSVELLLVFAFIRSFLLLSVLVVFVSFGVRYWNFSCGLDRQFSAASYDIYLTHYWFVIAFQMALLSWGAGPIMAKAAIVFVAALGLSFIFSRWVLARYPRWFVAALLSLFVFCLAFRP